MNTEGTLKKFINLKGFAFPYMDNIINLKRFFRFSWKIILLIINVFCSFYQEIFELIHQKKKRQLNYSSENDNSDNCLLEKRLFTR